MNDFIVVQNIFIGCELWKFFGCFDERFLNQQVVDIFKIMWFKLDLQVMVGSLMIVKQQMVEIVKVLFYQFWVLIMDELIVVLNDVEIVDFFLIICDFKVQGVGIVYISYKMDELKCIVDCVIIMCDGEFVDIVLVSEMFISIIIIKMVGCEVKDEFFVVFDILQNFIVLEV